MKIQLLRNVTPILALIFTFLLSCETPSKTTEMSTNKQPDTKGTEANRVIISAPVRRELPIAIDGTTKPYEYYIERSIQNYFIKFCESSVTKEEIQQELDLQEGMIKTLKLEIEYRNGAWDHCQEKSGEELASRMGEYVVIHQLFK